MKQFKKVLLGILVLSSIMLCSGSYQFFDAENGIIPVTSPEWNIVSAAEGKGSFVEEITVDKDLNSSKYEGVPYWVFHNDGKLYNIYIPNLEDYATSIEPIFPEGFSIEEYYNRQFLHNADSEGGASGGPIVRSNSQFTVCGIHSGAYDSNNNAAVRITSSLIQYFNFFVNLS